jgi:Dehydrogenases with different specificities (related to short-chain alcohol dehydrogenases)
MKLTGKIAIVTGGSRGIGFAIAKTLSENGATVVITSKDSEKIKKAESKISNAFGIACDIKKKNEVQNVVNQTIGKIW